MIREAAPADVPALRAIEDRCFESDRLSVRSFRHLLKRGHADIILDEDEASHDARGYSLVLFHRGTSLARLYSFAVDPACRGRGVGRDLLKEAEGRALDRGAVVMRLEVREDNVAARRLYEKSGYRQFAISPHYYEDGMAAVRMDKTLAPGLGVSAAAVPYYAQTLEFTCGPAALMMAMKALRPGMDLDRTLEMRLWREATTIFMAGGFGGCGPLGLALAARRRGFDVEVHVSDPVALFIEEIRGEEKREVVRLVQEDFLRELTAEGVSLSRECPSVDAIAEAATAGGIPIVLISSYRLMGDKELHWAVVSGTFGAIVYLHDPYVDRKKGKTATDCFAIPVARREFSRMARCGRSKHFAVLVIRNSRRG